MATKYAMNQSSGLHDDLSYLHVTGTTTLDPSQRVVGVAGAGGAFTLTLPFAEECEGLHFHIFREDATNSVTVAPPTGNAAFQTAQVITAIATGYTLLLAIHGRWFVLDSELT